MQSNDRNKDDYVLDEELTTREYIHQVSDSLHQQIWEVRRITNETRFIVGSIFWIVCLLFVIISWNFIAAIVTWLIGFLLLLHKAIEPAIESVSWSDVQKFFFWSVLIFVGGFISIFILSLIHI